MYARTRAETDFRRLRAPARLGATAAGAGVRELHLSVAIERRSMLIGVACALGTAYGARKSTSTLCSLFCLKYSNS